MGSGTVYFFTGLAGAGKTTLGKIFFEHLKAKKPNVVVFDGDITRQKVWLNSDYSTEARLRCALQEFRVIKMLADQGIDVVICSISMYDQVRNWNRENIQNYKEIYIKVSMDTLYARDQKKLYSEGINVVGKDLPYDEPQCPDLIVQNEGDENPEVLVAEIEKALAENVPQGFVIGNTSLHSGIF